MSGVFQMFRDVIRCGGCSRENFGVLPFDQPERNDSLFMEMIPRLLFLGIFIIIVLNLSHTI